MLEEGSQDQKILGLGLLLADGALTVSPGILVICPVDKKRDYHIKNRLFAPNIQIFGSIPPKNGFLAQKRPNFAQN